MYVYRNSDGSVNERLLTQCIAQARAAGDHEARARMERLLDAPRERARVEHFLSSDGATIDVFGDIGEGWFGDGLTTARVAQVLASTTGPITLRINSGGGDAFEGIAIRALLAAAPNHITAQVLSLCASAATVVAMGADEIEIAPAGVFMIHDAAMRTAGGEAEHESSLQLLRGINESTAALYAARAKKEPQEMRQLMRVQSWLTAESAVEMGLVDRVSTALAATQSAPVDLSCAPEQVRALLHRATVPHMKELLAALGLPETATEAEALAALAAREAQTTATPAPAAQPAQAAAPTVELAADVARDQIAAVYQDTATAHVDRLIGEGRILPASREKAIKACGTTPAQLQACLAVWEAQPALVSRPGSPTVAPRAGTVAPAARQLAQSGAVTPETMSDLQKRMARDSRMTPAQWCEWRNSRAPFSPHEQG